MLPYFDILNHLDHARFCSGQELAKFFGVTRATIHNCILRIEAMGIAVEKIRGKGYRLLWPLDLLNDELICSKLSKEVRDKLFQIDIQKQVNSTNDCIAKFELPSNDHFSVMLAEMQTAGKGRRGKVWQSPYAANLYMSLLWSLQKPLSEIGALSPLLAISIVRALEDLDVSGLGLKWPNDIYCHNQKLAGLLIECSGEMNSQTKLIVGIGVNVYMSQQENIHIDQQWTDIITHTSNQSITRNEVAASILNHVVLELNLFDRAASNSLIDDWGRWDIMKDKPVVLHSTNEDIFGTARGIDQFGHLLLETSQGLQAISAGDVSLRACA